MERKENNFWFFIYMGSLIFCFFLFLCLVLKSAEPTYSARKIAESMEQKKAWEFYIYSDTPCIINEKMGYLVDLNGNVYNRIETGFYPVPFSQTDKNFIKKKFEQKQGELSQTKIFKLK